MTTNRTITDSEIEALAHEAEAGYDIDHLVARCGSKDRIAGRHKAESPRPAFPPLDSGGCVRSSSTRHPASSTRRQRARRSSTNSTTPCRCPRHERRLPTYGSIVLPTVDVDGWAAITGLHTELSRTTTRHDDDVRRYADGLTSWTVRSPSGIDTLAVFDRSAGSERDLLVLAEAAAGGTIVQRRPDRGVRLVGTFGVARWDSAGWYVERPVGSWLRRRELRARRRRGRRARPTPALRRPRPRRCGHRRASRARRSPGGRHRARARRTTTTAPRPPDRPRAAPARARPGRRRCVLRWPRRAAPPRCPSRPVHCGGDRDRTAGRHPPHLGSPLQLRRARTATVVVVSEDGPVTVLPAGEIVGRSRPNPAPPPT